MIQDVSNIIPHENYRQIVYNKSVNINNFFRIYIDQVSDGDDDDEDLLAACINIGMQNNR